MNARILCAATRKSPNPRFTASATLLSNKDLQFQSFLICLKDLLAANQCNLLRSCPLFDVSAGQGDCHEVRKLIGRATEHRAMHSSDFSGVVVVVRWMPVI